MKKGALKKETDKIYKELFSEDNKAEKLREKFVNSKISYEDYSSQMSKISTNKTILGGTVRKLEDLARGVKPEIKKTTFQVPTGSGIPPTIRATEDSGIGMSSRRNNSAVTQNSGINDGYLRAGTAAVMSEIDKLSKKKKKKASDISIKN